MLGEGGGEKKRKKKAKKRKIFIFFFSSKKSLTQWKWSQTYSNETLILQKIVAIIHREYEPILVIERKVIYGYFTQRNLTFLGGGRIAIFLRNRKQCIRSGFSISQNFGGIGLQ